MPTLLIPKSLYTKSLPLRGILTVIGRKPIGPGPLTITDGQDSFEVEVTETQMKHLNELTAKDAVAEGFTEAKTLRNFIKNHFPTTERLDALTIIRWKVDDL
jgi:hypothetical protein